nr:MAG: hypothetical protein 1 [Leviviridae sp.]
MSIARTRSYSMVPVQGTYRMVYRPTGQVFVNSTGSYVPDQAVMDDQTGAWPSPGHLWSRRTTRSGSTVNYDSGTSGAYRYTYTNYPSSWCSTSWSNPFPAIRDVSQAELLGRSGPLTPGLNLPLAAIELRDVPRMLKHAGDLLHNIKSPSGLSPDKEAASAILAYQFGWAPLAGDLLKLADLSGGVEKTRRKLQRAGEPGSPGKGPGGYRHKITIADDTVVRTVSNYAVFSGAGIGVINRTITITSTRKTWATVRWRLRPGQQFGSVPSYEEALKIHLGLKAGMIPITAWKAIPWTWLIDWFTDMSNVLQANRNMISYEPYNACRMENIIHEARHAGFTTSNGATLGSGKYRYETKHRNAWPLSTGNLPTLKLPAMDGFQTSVLGSLAILKIRKNQAGSTGRRPLGMSLG